MDEAYARIMSAAMRGEAVCEIEPETVVLFTGDPKADNFTMKNIRVFARGKTEEVLKRESISLEGRKFGISSQK